MQIAKTLAGFSGPEGGRPAQGDRQEEPRGDGQAQAGVLRGLPGVGHRPDVIETLWATNEKSADYSFNKCARDTRVILPDGKRIRLSRRTGSSRPS